MCVSLFLMHYHSFQGTWTNFGMRHPYTLPMVKRGFHRPTVQQAQLSPSDRAMRLVSSNLASCTQQRRNYLYDKS